MHEISYCEGVAEAVLRRAAGRQVARIGVRIGAVHRVVPEAFQQSFQLVAAGSPAADAVTELTVVPVQGSCRGCGAAFESADPAPACPRCGSFEVGVQGGDEVVLEWLEYRGDDRDRSAELVPEHTHAAEVG